MTKKEHIKYWLDIADMDLIRAERCFKDKDYVFCLFCLHMVLEKTIKALWVKCNDGNVPPKIHNLAKLLKNLPIDFDEDERAWLDDMNRFQLEGRYPDYVGKIHKRCTKEFTKEMMKTGNNIRQCLIKELQKK
jgi:HEPN domain-containing protein